MTHRNQILYVLRRSEEKLKQALRMNKSCDNIQCNQRKRKRRQEGNNRKLSKEDYDIHCYNLANSLLGKLLVRRTCNLTLKGRIVETECYLGGDDKASHSYKGRRTPACEPMYMTPGTAYVYMTYGMYYCFNISSNGEGAAVLIRAVEPIEGEDHMLQNRLGLYKLINIFRYITIAKEACCKVKNSTKYTKSSFASIPFSAKRKVLRAATLQNHELCNGPSKLCMSMNITKDTCNKLDMSVSDELWIEDDEWNCADFNVVKTSRIGIDSVGEEWAKKPLRFYVMGNRSVSKRDKIAENTFNDDCT